MTALVGQRKQMSTRTTSIAKSTAMSVKIQLGYSGTKPLRYEWKNLTARVANRAPNIMMLNPRRAKKAYKFRKEYCVRRIDKSPLLFGPGCKRSECIQCRKI
ncbi:hypothetical protein ES707_18890 [subsurface metagenome]